MDDLTEDTLADLFTLGTHPPTLRRVNTFVYKGQPVPAAGAGFAYTVPPDWWMRFIAASFTFTADATAQARGVNIVLADADGSVLDANPAIGLALASQVIPVVADMQIPGATPANADQFAYGTAAAPAAGGAVAAIGSLVAGLYNVKWTAEVSGTLTAGTDNDNMRIVTAGTVYARAVYPATAGAYPQQPVQVWVPAGGSLNLQANGAATAGSTYAGSITATLLQPSPVQAMLPDLILKPGSSISLAAVNFHAGDQLSAIVMMAERYPSNWADGALGSDEEGQLRRWLARERAGSWQG